MSPQVPLEVMKEDLERMEALLHGGNEDAALRASVGGAQDAEHYSVAMQLAFWGVWRQSSCQML